MASAHDPGPERAGERGEEHAAAARRPLQLGEGTVRIGTASWTDPTMTAAGVFYPPDASTAEDRLRYDAADVRREGAALPRARFDAVVAKVRDLGNLG